MPAYLLVRAIVPEADRDAFEVWYQTEHLPDAKKAFNARSARRGWSDVTPGIHVAMYEFPDLATAQATLAGAATAELIAEFDRVWQGRVTREREVVGIAQIL